MEALGLNSTTFLSISLLPYLFSGDVYLLSVLLKRKQLSKPGLYLFIIGIVMQSIALILRTIEVRHAPFVTIYEAMMFWSWLIGLTFLFFELRFKFAPLGAIVAEIIFVIVLVATFMPARYKEASLLVPALQSRWLEFHIGTALVAYSCFAISFSVSLIYLFKKSDEPEAFMNKERLDNIGYKAIGIGFAFLTLGIISGSIWANLAWGRYWGWDPKEVWSLITWLIYAVYLHLRIIAKWKGKPAAITSVIGFLSVIFTFFGVSFLLEGLHSYG